MPAAALTHTGKRNGEEDNEVAIMDQGRCLATEDARAREDQDHRHSDKSDCAHEWFERHWPNTPKIELNARRQRAGWAAWGNEVSDAA